MDEGLGAIFFVINGTEPRINLAVNKTVKRLKNILPDSVMSNVMAVMTNCTSLAG